MYPIKFKEANVVFAKDQTEYNNMPAFKAQSSAGEVVSCWKLSFIERLRILLLGKIWLSVLSFNYPLQPTFLTTKKSDIFTTKKNQ